MNSAGFGQVLLMSLRHLPPLDLLRPFEASARLRSFTAAAEELSVTQSAVSQRVRTLEKMLGVRLFHRRHRAIDLTAEGRELLNGVRAALQHLSAATYSLRQSERRPRLKLAADTSMAAFWLQPRLTSFLSRGSPCAIDLTVSDSEAELLEADVAVLHGEGSWSGFAAHMLFPDEIFPVCSPGYLRQQPIEMLDDLLKADLLDLDYTHWNWMNWSIWLTEMGLDPSSARVLVRTNSYPSQIDAARAGLGVALGWRCLVDEDMRTGRLVQPVAHSMRTAYGYHLLIRHLAGEDALRLARHLMAEP